MPESPTPVIDYTARDYERIKDQLEAFVLATRPTEWTDFFEANLGISLVEMLALVGDIVSLGQDVLAQETYLSTARRLELPLRFARSVGYVPKSALAAQVLVKSGTLSSNIVNNGATIAKGSAIAGANGLRYEVTEDVTVAPGTSQVSIILSEGTSRIETFEPTRASGQEFVSAHGIVQDDSWEVFVGDTTNPSNKWAQVANITFELLTTQTYEVFFDGDGKLHLKFGDGNAGKIPDETITLNYRTTEGARGNASIGTIRGNLQPNVLVIATTESVAVENVDAASTGGRDRESVDEMRVSVPAFIRTLDQVRTITDYEDATQNLAGVELVFADVPLASFSGNIVRVHVWDTEQINFSVTSSESGRTSTVVYNRYLQVPTTRVHTVQQYLGPRTYASIHNIVVRPTIADVDLYFGRIAYDRNLFTADDVHEAIVQALVDLFESRTCTT